MTDPNHKPALPGLALSAGMLWLLAGALYKLFEGSPNDLPEMVREMSPLSSSWATMRTAIIVELVVVGLVIAKPRLGWLLLAGTFATFMAVLFPLVQAGESSCGCFGSNITIKPLVMMGIDGALLLLILISRPWRMSKDAGLGWAAFLPLLAMAVAAPTMKLTEPALPTLRQPSEKPAHSSEVVKPDDSKESPLDETANNTNESVEGGDPDSPEVVDGSSETEPIVEPVVEDVEEEVVVNELPEFFELRHDTWDSKMFDETDIAAFLDQSMGAVLPNSHVVVYRQTCTVCGEHLEGMAIDAMENPSKWAGEKQLVLIRIIEHKDATEDNHCVSLPEPHQRVSMPALKRGYGITTPLTFDVDENYTVQNVQDLSEH